MATLVFSAVGTALGGPLGGALGALIGNQLDRAVVGSPKREGPRLKELAVTTSSYGTPIARHYGRMRVPGTVIWATDLKENKESSGGQKGSPSITTYAYSISFAVAVSSRPIAGIIRIWADGNLLRGAAGDLKVGGHLRVYNGHGDQLPDPLIVSDRGPACPAFRNLAYCVFEDLQLADFGNRIPSLTFEIIADSEPLSLEQMTAGLDQRVDAAVPLPGLAGYSDEGGPLAATLATIDQLYPMVCDGSGEVLVLAPAEDRAETVAQLPDPAVDAEDDSFGGLYGTLRRRIDESREIPDGLRYYDTDRDFQPGLQRAEGRARTGRTRTIEFPGAMASPDARQSCTSLVQRAGWSGDQLLWRIAEFDPAIVPGRIVSAPGHSGTWRIETWEWRTSGIELELRRLPPGSGRTTQADPGAFRAPRDAIATPTIVHAFELPWNGTGQANERRVYAAVSSSSSGWTGAALYGVNGSALTYLQPSGSGRSVLGTLATPLSASSCVLLDRDSRLEVQLASNDLILVATDLEGLADGRNRALVGDEVLQFANASALGSGVWQLEGILRGRGGTEAAARRGHAAGAAFVLLDDTPVLLDPANPVLATAQEIAAIGLADETPVISRVANAGSSQRPLTPVHPAAAKHSDGTWRLSWTRRARGSFIWPERSDVPLVEQDERYVVGVGEPDSPSLSWETTEPSLVLNPDTTSLLRANHPGETMWVRQVGTVATSAPLLIHVID